MVIKRFKLMKRTQITLTVYPKEAYYERIMTFH